MQRYVVSVAAVLLLIATFSAHAEVYQWISPAGGSFTDPTNWLDPLYQPGVPQSGDEAHFGVGTSYTVTLPDAHENDAIFVYDNMVDFNLGGSIYWVRASTGEGVIIRPAFSGGLTVRNGSVYSYGSVVVDSSAGTADLVIASDGLMQMSSGIPGPGNLVIGDVGTGSVQTEGSLLVEGTTVISAGSLLTVSGGNFTTYWIDTGGNSGRVDWTGGAFTVEREGLVVGPNGPLGSSLLLYPGKPLSVGGTTTIDDLSNVMIQYGVFSTGKLDFDADPLRFEWLSGTLNLTDSDLLFGTGGLLEPLGIDTISSEKRLGVDGTATVAADRVLFINGGAMTVGQSNSHGVSNSLQVDSGGALIVEGGTVLGSPSGPTGPGMMQIESDGLVAFSGGLLAADTVVLMPGGTITAAASDPPEETNVTSTLRANALSGFGPGLQVPEFLNLQLGHAIGSAGSVISLNGDPLSLSGGNATLTVGYDSEATVTINWGSTGETPRLVIGEQPTAIGVVEIDGPTTTWDVGGEVRMGGGFNAVWSTEGGQGELNITGGATLTSRGGKVGFAPGSNATVNVVGANSLWTTDVDLNWLYNWIYIGSQGTGTLNILDGGTVRCPAILVSLDFANGNFTSDATVNVDGATSRLQAANIKVGGFGHGELRMTHGATVEGMIGYGYPVNLMSLLEDGSVTVESGSTLLTNQSELMNHDYGATGLDPIITITGDGSTWTNGTLDIGVGTGTPTTTPGPKVLVEAGGHVTTGRVSIGLMPGTTGTLTVTGANSRLDVDDGLAVAGDADPYSSEFGGRGSLLVEDGGRVYFTTQSYPTAVLFIGRGERAVGTAMIDGSSRLMSDAPIWVGALGGTGELILSNGSLVTSDGAVIGQGTGEVAASQGSVVVDASTWDNGSAVVEVGGSGGSGAIHLIRSGGVVASSVIIYSGSVIDGNGEISGHLVINGTASPGLSPGTLDVIGEFSQTSTGMLEIEIGGLTPGSQFDVVNVTGDSALAGDLIVSLIDPLGGTNLFVPSAGDTFEILTAGELLGTFDSESFPAIPCKPGLEWLIDYDTAADRVLLSVAPIFEADFDEDGDVDGDDLDVWELGYGTGTLHTQGDANGDGKVNGGDYLMWQRQFGSSISLVTANSAVPEPATATLLSIAIIVLSFRPQSCINKHEVCIASNPAS